MQQIPTLGTAPRHMVQEERVRIYFLEHPKMHFAAQVISTGGIFIGAWKAAMAGFQFMADKFRPRPEDVFGLKIVAVGIGLFGVLFGFGMIAPLLWDAPFSKMNPSQWLSWMTFERDRPQGLAYASKEQVLTAIEVLGGPEKFVEKMRDEILISEKSFRPYCRFMEDLGKIGFSSNSGLFASLADGKIKKQLLDELLKSLTKEEAPGNWVEIPCELNNHEVDYLLKDGVITEEQATKLKGMIVSAEFLNSQRWKETFNSPKPSTPSDNEYSKALNERIEKAKTDAAYQEKQRATEVFLKLKEELVQELSAAEQAIVVGDA